MASNNGGKNARHSEWDTWVNNAISDLEKDSLLRSLRPVRVASLLSDDQEEEEEKKEEKEEEEEEEKEEEKEGVDTLSRRFPMRQSIFRRPDPDGVLRSRQSAVEQRQVAHSQRQRPCKSGIAVAGSSSTQEKENDGEDERPPRQAKDSLHLVVDNDQVMRSSRVNPSPVTVQITDTTREAWLNNTPTVGQEDSPEAISHASLAEGSCNKLPKQQLHRVKLFSGNDYLGLSAHPDVCRASAKAAVELGNGPRASPLICGYTNYHRQLEVALARLKCTEECLLFPTGFAANLAVITSLCSRSPAAKWKDADASLQRTPVGERSPFSPISMASSLSSSALLPTSFSSASSTLLSSRPPSLSSAPSPQSFQISSDRTVQNNVGRTGDNDRQQMGRGMASPQKGIRAGPDGQEDCSKEASEESWVTDMTRREEERRDRVAIFSDALNHASIIDGIRLAEKQSNAVVNVYRHNDMQHLDQLLSKCEHKRKLVVMDSLFSMDGDFAPLRQLVELKRKHGFLLVIDEAHATLVFGKRGAGLAEACGVEQDIDIFVGTLSKAVGCHGGFAACSTKWKQWILSRGRSYIFSTALPIPTVAAAIEALSVSEREPWRRRAVQLRVQQFSDAIGIPFESPICPLVVGSEESTLIAARELLLKGIHVPAIRPPTVPPNSCRLRITFSAAHTPRDIQALITALPDWVISNARRFLHSLPLSGGMLLTKGAIARKSPDLVSDATDDVASKVVVVQSTDRVSPNSCRNGNVASLSMDAGLASSGTATAIASESHCQESSKRELVDGKRARHGNNKALLSSRARL